VIAATLENPSALQGAATQPATLPSDSHADTAILNPTPSSLCLQQQQQQQVLRLHRLSLETAFRSATCLVEWPERLPPQLIPAERLDVFVHVLTGAAGMMQSASRPQPIGGGSQLMQGSCSEDAAAATGHLEAGAETRRQWQEEAETSPDSSDDSFNDRRVREVSFAAYGMVWAARIERLRQFLQYLSHGLSSDCDTVVSGSAGGLRVLDSLKG
jgi:hypothetical protein